MFMKVSLCLLKHALFFYFFLFEEDETGITLCSPDVGQC